MNNCIHHEGIDRDNVATCIHCGQVKQYPRRDGELVKIIKEGDPMKAKKQQIPIPEEVKKEVLMKEQEVKPRGAFTEERAARHKYFEGHKEEIKKSLLEVGRSATEKDWGISSSSMQGLMKRWLSPEEVKKVKEIHKGPPLEAGTPGETKSRVTFIITLPNFPEFNEGWYASTKEEWLRAYTRLTELGIQHIRKEKDEAERSAGNSQ